MHNRNNCLGLELDSKWNWERQTGEVLTKVFTNVVQLLALFLIDGICNLVSALLLHSGWGGPACGYVPCSDISKAWSSKPQYCKIHANLLNLFAWWLTNDVGCMFKCQPSPEWMEQISCWVQDIAYKHLFQHPAAPGRLWCLLFPKATWKTVLHSDLHSKSVKLLLQGHNYCSVLLPLLFTNDNVRSLAQCTVLFGDKNSVFWLLMKKNVNFAYIWTEIYKFFPLDCIPGVLAVVFWGIYRSGFFFWHVLCFI